MHNIIKRALLGYMKRLKAQSTPSNKRKYEEKLKQIEFDFAFEVTRSMQSMDFSQ